ncbi:MAG: DUF971 domain-containing protein [Gammaproteobacteria bacterium]|nr:MAG: DUF971 domain-containing protein [Gammaproteobacteria bacterium]
MLVLGKENVGIRAVEPVGQYAVKLVFDDDDNPRRISILTVPLSPMRAKGTVPEQ